MLEFLLGTSESEKQTRIYSRAVSDAQSGKSAFVLVPEQYSMYAEEELISRLGLSAQNKIQVLTFSRLANMLFSKLGPLRTKYADKAGKYLLACRSMQLCKGDLSCFSGNASQSGFSGLIVSLISEFKRYSVSPSALLTASEKFAGTTLSAKLSDLAKIYEKFNFLLEETGADAEDNLPLAIPKIKQADFISGTIYISFFRSFTPVEYEALKMLMTKADLCISLCSDSLTDDSAAFFSQNACYKNLCHMAAELGITVKAPHFYNEQQNPDSFSELLHLKENYFSPAPSKVKGIPESIHILKPQNYYAEVQQAARIILSLCRTKGYSFNDFLVLTGDAARYSLLLPSVFRQHEISFFMDRKLNLAESPLMRMLLSILEILAFGFSYTRIMTILRSGFWSIASAEADIFENYILAADISHKQWNEKGDWAFNPRSAFDMDKINEIKKAVTTPLLDLLSSFKGRKTISNICSGLCSWLNQLNIQASVETKAQFFRNQGSLEEAEYTEAVWNSFASLIARISDCMGDTNATFAEFYELFSACCGELTVGIIPPTQDKVMISEIGRFRSTGVKVVIVLGVVDGVFPQAITSEGIISDAERLLLKESGFLLAPDSYTRQKEDLFLIYSVFSTPQNELYLLSPVSDSDGKSLGGSEIIKNIKSNIFPDLQFESGDNEFDLIEGKESTFSELCARLFECNFDLKKLPPLWKSVFDCFNEDESYAKKLQHFENMNTLANTPDELSPKLVKKLYGEPLTLSVSKLEKYNACAFSYFMRYGLLADERLLGGLKSTDTGTILHDILCRYFKNKKDADYSGITRDECFNEISDILSDITKSADNPLFTTSNYYGYMLTRLKSIATSTAWKLVGFYSNSDFRPAGFEVSFGKHGALPPYELKTKNGPVYLKGFIDKIDLAHIGGSDYIAITDYKSSEKRLDPAMIDAGITIQPFIYANAVASAKEGQIPAAMMYLQMNDPILSFDSPPDEKQWETEMNNGIKAHGIFLDEPEVISAIDHNCGDKASVHYITCDAKSRLVKELFEKRLSDAELCASETADKISDGIIEANPPAISGFDPCEYCPYMGICKKS